MWIVCSRNRPHLVERIFSKVTPTEKGIIAIDDDQIEMYAGVVLPDRWSFFISPRANFGPKNNEVFAQFPDEPFYGSLNDDMHPQTQGWDSILPHRAGRFGISWADDCLKKRAGCLAFGGDLIRALGFICAPGVKHFFNDNVHETIARDLGLGSYCGDVKVPHLHWSNDKAEKDATYLERPSHADDMKAFNRWKDHAWPALKLKVQQVMQVC